MAEEKKAPLPYGGIGGSAIFRGNRLDLPDSIRPAFERAFEPKERPEARKDLCLNPACGAPALLITGYCEAHSIAALTDDPTPDTPAARPPMTQADIDRVIEMGKERDQLRRTVAEAKVATLKIRATLRQPTIDPRSAETCINEALDTVEALLLLLKAGAK